MRGFFLAVDSLVYCAPENIASLEEALNSVDAKRIAKGFKSANIEEKTRLLDVYVAPKQSANESLALEGAH